MNRSLLKGFAQWLVLLAMCGLLIACQNNLRQGASKPAHVYVKSTEYGYVIAVDSLYGGDYIQLTPPMNIGEATEKAVAVNKILGSE